MVVSRDRHGGCGDCRVVGYVVGTVKQSGSRGVCARQVEDGLGSVGDKGRTGLVGSAYQ